MPTNLAIAKFGGSALGPDGANIPKIISRIRQMATQDPAAKVIAVFSAPLTRVASGGSDRVRSLTDIILEQGKNAESRASRPTTDAARRAYLAALKHLGGGGGSDSGSNPARAACEDLIEGHLAMAQGALDESYESGEFAGEARSRALAFSGEILMSHIMKHILISNGIPRTDSVPFERWPIITDHNIESSNFMAEESRERLGPTAAMLEANDVITIGGFIGKTEKGVATTYERGGTDRTAIDLGILFHKSYDTRIDFEKDSAVVSADPKIVQRDLSEVGQLSYNEARLAGMFGMKILDPVAIKEAVENGVDLPIVVTNLNRPEETTTIRRTLVPGGGAVGGASNPIKIVTGKSNCAIFRIETTSMQKLLESLESDRRYSEFVILSPYTKDGTEFGRMLFLDADYIRRNEKYFRSFDPLATITYGRGVITLIGDEMWRVQQVASRTSSRVGEAGLNILNMDAQEETSRIIIVIEDAGDNIARAISYVHDEVAAINRAHNPAP